MTQRIILGPMVALAAGIVSGCVIPPPAPTVIQADAPYRMATGSSVMPAACLGLDQSRGMQVIGRSLYDVTVILRTKDGKPVVRAWAPANEGTSVSTRVEREPLPGRPRCKGESLQTEIIKAADGDILRWSLEVGAPSDAGSSGVVLRGEMPIARKGGTATSNVTLGDMLMTAEVSATRGAWGILMDARDAPKPKFPQFGKPLPDERSDRTLDEMRRDGQLRGDVR